MQANYQKYIFITLAILFGFGGIIVFLLMTHRIGVGLYIPVEFTDSSIIQAEDFDTKDIYGSYKFNEKLYQRIDKAREYAKSIGLLNNPETKTELLNETREDHTKEYKASYILRRSDLKSCAKDVCFYTKVVWVDRITRSRRGTSKSDPSRTGLVDFYFDTTLEGLNSQKIPNTDAYKLEMWMKPKPSLL